ncbi:MAG: hypothetical protein WAN13_14580, partial [Candidatus Acidiferrales bacterium]
MTPGAPASIDVNGFVIATLIGSGGVWITNESNADDELVVTDVAVIVGELFGAAGTVAGGVYVALKLGAGAAARVPHAGLHGEPP